MVIGTQRFKISLQIFFGSVGGGGGVAPRTQHLHPTRIKIFSAVFGKFCPEAVVVGALDPPLKYKICGRGLKRKF